MLFKSKIKKQKSHTFWMLAGFLDPTYFSKLEESIREGLEEEMRFEVIAGPKICVLDEDFELTQTTEYWQAHPILNLIKDFHKTGKSKLYLRKPNSLPTQRVYIGSTNEKAPFITMRIPKNGLEEGAVLIENKTRVGYNHGYRTFEEMINSGAVSLWNPDNPESKNLISFKKYSELKDPIKTLQT